MSDSRFNWRGTFVIVTMIVAALCAFIFYRMETWPGRTARQVSKAFAEVAHLQPRITVRDRVFFEQTTSVLELAVVSRETQIEREMEHEWLGSMKRIKLRAVFHVKAGFDLTQPFNVRVEEPRPTTKESPRKIRVRTELPPPRILSVDQQDIEVLAFENGIWNRIRASDVEAEVRALPVLARQKASEAGLQNEALEIFKMRLKDKLAPQFEVEIKVASGVPRPSL
jgi:hypothetical protein